MKVISTKIQKKGRCLICKNPLHSGKVYCSLRCYWRKSPRFQTSCKQCRKLFWTYPSFQKVGEGFLCSRECKYRWISEQYRGEKSKSGFKNASIKKVCKICKNIYLTTKSRIEAKRGIYCSKECMSEDYRERFGRENNPNWIDGKGNKYGAGWTRSLKKRLKERDGYKCVRCGAKENLSIHHINYDGDDNSEINLITLCMPCNVADIKMNRHKYIKND